VLSLKKVEGKDINVVSIWCYTYALCQRHLEDRAKVREIETIISTDQPEPVVRLCGHHYIQKLKHNVIHVRETHFPHFIEPDF